MSSLFINKLYFCLLTQKISTFTICTVKYEIFGFRFYKFFYLDFYCFHYLNRSYGLSSLFSSYVDIYICMLLKPANSDMENGLKKIQKCPQPIHLFNFQERPYWFRLYTYIDIFMMQSDGNSFAQMSSWTALTRSLRIKITIQKKYIKANMFLVFMCFSSFDMNFPQSLLKLIKWK